MKHIGYLFVIGIVLMSCQQQKKELIDQSKNSEPQTEQKTEEKTKKPKINRYGSKIFYEEEFEMTDRLIKNSVKNFAYVKNVWSDSLFVCFGENEIVRDFIKADFNRLLVETRNDHKGFIYDMDVNGNILFKHELDLNNNFYYSDYRVYNQKVYFKSNTRTHDTKYWMYNPDSLKCIEVTGAEELPSIYSSRYNKLTYSPDGSLAVMIDYECMLLNYFHEDRVDTVIDLHAGSFTTDWCFNSVCWNDDGDKFYFDNSGEIACIWEVDLKNSTIDKIVPDHFAEKPVFLDNTVFYLNDGCIRKATFQRFGSSQVSISDNYAYKTITLDSLNKLDFYIAQIDSFPPSDLLAHTSNAYIAVKAGKKTYKVKLLYTYSDSIFIETTSLTLLHSGFKCAEPVPIYSDGTVEYSCDWDNGRTYGEKFKVENNKLYYQGSYYFETPDPNGSSL